MHLWVLKLFERTDWKNYILNRDITSRRETPLGSSCLLKGTFLCAFMVWLFWEPWLCWVKVSMLSNRKSVCVSLPWDIKECNYRDFLFAPNSSRSWILNSRKESFSAHLTDCVTVFWVYVVSDYKGWYTPHSCRITRKNCFWLIQVFIIKLK